MILFEEQQNYFMEKTMKKYKALKISIILILISFLIMISFDVTSIIVANQNKSRNLENQSLSTLNHIIYNQHNDYLQDVKYGLGTFAKNGCGSAAVYNLLLLDNQFTPLSDIIYNLEQPNKQFFFGLLGTRPSAIKKYLQSFGYSVKLHANKNDFDQLSKNSKFSILITVSFHRGHYQLIQYEETQNNTNYYNTYNLMFSHITMKQIFNHYNDSFLNLLLTVN